MKFGLRYCNTNQYVEPAKAVELAQAAEETGFESIWTIDHVVVPDDYAPNYPYSEDGRMSSGSPSNARPDAIVWMTYVAAATKTLKLGTGVLVLPQRQLVTTAKQIATLDQMSSGRVLLGVGVGWMPEEFRALGVPFERRGARFDDYVAGMRKIWSGDVVEHQSDFISWSGFKSYPLPIQNPFPVVMGGVKGKIFERTAKLGNGWFAPTGDPAELKGHMENLKKECDAIGRDMTEIEITCMWPGVGGKEFLQQLSDVGVGRVVVPMMGAGDPMERLTKIAEEVIA